MKLSVSDLSFAYEGKKFVEKVNFQIGVGFFVFLFVG